jgi:CubicO group peptidase (beta-lactamase class C family)
MDSMNRKTRVLWIAACALSVAAITSPMLLRPVRDPARSLEEQLRQIVAEEATRHASIKNCVLSVTSGDGSLVWAGAAGVAHHADATPMTPDTLIYVASVSKLYTATAVMLLKEQGRLSLDDPMSKYLPTDLISGIHRYGGIDYSTRITIRQLLSHRSGIADYYEEKAADGKSLFELLVESPGRAWTVDDTIARARALEAHFVPGTGTFYSDTNYQLLGKIIEAVAGKPLHAVFQEFFFAPLNLTHTHLGLQLGAPNPADVFDGSRDITEARANRAYWADGGIVSTAREMNLFLKALSEGRIIRPESLRSMHDWHAWKFPLKYGLGTMYFDLSRPVATSSGMYGLWGHSGSTGSFLYRSDELDLYMAGTLDQTDARAEAFLLLWRVMRAFEAARRHRPGLAAG